MTLRYSTGARNYMAQNGGLRDAFNNGKIEIYSGAQPTTADAAVTGTLLCTITSASAAHTPEVLATGTVTLNSGASGSVDTVSVNSISLMSGAVAFNTSLTQTAADVAAAINANRATTGYSASSSGAVITIRALRGTGTAPNGFTVVSTVTTITKTDVNMASGVAAVNGIKFGAAAAGVIAKLSTQTWSGVNAASGTAGYYRAYGSVSDAGAADSTEATIREDGAIATSGAQLNLSSVSLTAAATTTISSWSRTLPAA